MDVRIETPEEGKKELFVSVETERLTPKFEKAYQDYSKKIVVSGFRKGKVPVALVKQMFGKTIRDEVIDDVIPEFSQEAIDEQKLKIIPPARIDAVEFDLKSGLTFKVIVELLPEIELKKIKGFEFERETYELDDAAISQTLESIREQHATMQPSEAAAEDMDYVQTDLQQIDTTGVPIIGKKYENQYFRIDSKDEANYKLTRQFVGVKNGDVLKVTFEPPEGESAGNEPEFFEATIIGVQKRILPELDDEFAKDLGEYETLQELTDTVTKNLTFRLKNDNYQRFQSQVLDTLVKENSFDVPEKLVDLHLHMLIRDMKQRQPNNKLDEKMLADRYRAQTVWTVKWQMIRDKIIETEGLELKEEDNETFFQEQAELQGVEVDRVRNRYLTEDARNEIVPTIQEEKIVKFVVANSKVTEKTVPYSEVLAKK